ncbi:60 kDa lysophospholipase isoform X2 [Anoplophora glabripennis]|uniref:60 kDa lysophospholipase isoform X2 n=1 Tax=Anoplophora glabripennis TaxID=217634 RepID=UPI0008754DD6|nr:60 kDa lysophospholipase isoform X2 [Anoplophora glabripennis]
MEQFRKVLVLYVGGTIGMQQNDKGALIPIPNAFLQKIKYHSEMHDAEKAKKYFRALKENELILPPATGINTVIYELIEYSPLLDSSNMSTKEWVRIATDIGRNYNKYDGFVVLHGTDTMAYTSSVLSFMMEGLQKPVIITGSQIPIFETRSDAKDNVLSSLIIAGCYNIPEVCVFFANKLLRGNRTAKISSDDLDAFDSPNYHTLVDVGINMKINHHHIRKVDDSVHFKLHTNLNSKVVLLSFFPTITREMLQSYLKPPTQGIVIQSYGAGNLPSNRPDILQVLREAVEREILVINVTQCARGAVSNSYECGMVLEMIGLTSGRDMTVEAALTKLMYVLGLPELTYLQRVELMKTDLRGEITNT